jgi:predicted Zn finger-like uncharacterized protein
MKIVCPSCAATYEVPESVVASKRAVRCARCGGDWVPGGAEEPQSAPSVEATVAPPGAVEPIAPESPVAEEVSEPELIAEPPPVTLATPPATLAADQWQSVAAAIAAEAAAQPPTPATPKTPIAAWFVSVALLAILTASSVAFRAPIMKAWPASTRLYAVLGLYRP